MPRKPQHFPKDPADYHRFGHFVFWHLFEYGSRPDGDPSREIGQPWEMGDICNALGEKDPRTIRNWYNEKTLPDDLVPFCRVVFGAGRQWDKERRQLHELLRDAHASRSKEKEVEPKVEEAAFEDEPADDPVSETVHPIPSAEDADAGIPPVEAKAEPETTGPPDDVQQETGPLPDEKVDRPDTDAPPQPEAAPAKDEQPAKVLLPAVVVTAARPMSAGANRDLARWVVGICLASLIGGYAWYRWPRDFHWPRIALFQPTPAPAPSPKPAPAAPQIALPPVNPVPIPEVKPAAPKPIVPSPVVIQPPKAAPSPEPVPPKPLEKVLACVVGNADVRDLVAAGLRQKMNGKIKSGDCSTVDADVIVNVSGELKHPPNRDPACGTTDRHQYDLSLSVFRTADAREETGTVSPPTRCASPNREVDQGISTELRNQAVFLGIMKLQDLLKFWRRNNLKTHTFVLMLFLGFLCPSPLQADPLKFMQGLEGDIPKYGEQDNGVRLTAPLTLKNTSDQFIAIALIPPFPKVSASNGATYFMRDAGGVTRCRNNNPIMGPACMGKPFTQGITIAPGTYTVIEPGTSANFDFHMEVERGGGSGGTYATFSALFAVRTFSSLDEDGARSDSDNYKSTRTLNIGIPERRITPQGSNR